MKNIFIILFTFIAVIQTNAQNDEYSISLTPDSSFENLRFSCGEIIDARRNKENIGFVYRVFKGQVSAQLPGGILFPLKKTFDQITPINKKKLVFIIRYLYISENTAPHVEQTFCKIEFEFAKRIDTNLYSLGIFDSHIISGSNNQ
jgi:hypothetical protein